MEQRWRVQRLILHKITIFLTCMWEFINENTFYLKPAGPWKSFITTYQCEKWDTVWIYWKLRHGHNLNQHCRKGGFACYRKRENILWACCRKKNSLFFLPFEVATGMILVLWQLQMSLQRFTWTSLHLAFFSHRTHVLKQPSDLAQMTSSSIHGCISLACYEFTEASFEIEKKPTLTK